MISLAHILNSRKISRNFKYIFYTDNYGKNVYCKEVIQPKVFPLQLRQETAIQVAMQEQPYTMKEVMSFESDFD